jgi:hypothetical protein
VGFLCNCTYNKSVVVFLARGSMVQLAGKGQTFSSEYIDDAGAGMHAPPHRVPGRTHKLIFLQYRLPDTEMLCRLPS